MEIWISIASQRFYLVKTKIILSQKRPEKSQKNRKKSQKNCSQFAIAIAMRFFFTFPKIPTMRFFLRLRCDAIGSPACNRHFSVFFFNEKIMFCIEKYIQPKILQPTLFLDFRDSFNFCSFNLYLNTVAGRNFYYN